jgi:hypothetical protein
MYIEKQKQKDVEAVFQIPKTTQWKDFLPHLRKPSV